MKKFIRTLWELPQNAVGALVKRISKAEPFVSYKDAEVYSWRINGGLSLGKHIFVPFSRSDLDIVPDLGCYTLPRSVEEYIKHEYGHTLQSKRLGWLYLLVIALPSLTWAGCFGEYRKKTGTSYYDFYTERWANELGGVEREGKK